MGASKPFLDFGLSLSVIWRQILPATSLSLHIPTLPAPSCPSSLAAEDAGGHGLFVHSKTKLRWLIRTRHAWLASYQKKMKSLFYAAPAAQLERAGGWWFCCGEALPSPSAASQEGLVGPGEQGTTTNTPQRESCPAFHPSPCSVCVPTVCAPGRRWGFAGVLMSCLWCRRDPHKRMSEHRVRARRGQVQGHRLVQTYKQGNGM